MSETQSYRLIIPRWMLEGLYDYDFLLSANKNITLKIIYQTNKKTQTCA